MDSNSIFLTGQPGPYGRLTPKPKNLRIKFIEDSDLNMKGK
jgi:hypothetical protein